MAPTTRQTFPLSIGRGLDRATGLVAQSPASPTDARNVWARDAKMALRPGMIGTGFPSLAWGTDILCAIGVQATLEVLFAVFDRPTRVIRIYRLDTLSGVLQAASSPPNGVWGTVLGTDFPIVNAAESNGLVFFAHDEADITTRLPTIYYTPNFATPSTPGTLTTLMADLNSDGVSAPVYFRSVYAYLVYMWGWGYGTENVDEVDAPNSLRFSDPGDPTTYSPQNYFLAGVKRDPILTVVPTCAQVNTVSGVSSNSVLAVLKDNSAYRVVGTDPDTFGIEVLDPDYGVISSRMAISVGSTAYAWASDGPRNINPTGTVPIGQPLELVSPLPADFPTLGPSRDAFATFDPSRYLVEFLFPDLQNATVPVPEFALSLWNPQDPRWTLFTREQPVTCGGFLLFRDVGTGAVPPNGFASAVAAEDDGLAPNAMFRSVRVSWINNDADGDELVQLFAKPAGGSWAVVSTFAIVPGDQTQSWDTALPLEDYNLALRYIRGDAPAVGFESSDPDDWTSPNAAGAKTTVETTSEAVAWTGGAFVDSVTPINLTWASAQVGAPYLLEKSNDGGATYTTVASDLLANNYSYAIVPAELGTTVKFRLTAQRDAVAGPSAGTMDVPMFISVAQVTGLVGTFDPTTGLVALSWNAASGALTYLIEKSDNGGTSWSSVATIGPTNYTYTPTSPPSEINTTVDFRVSGINGAVTGLASAPVAVPLTVTITPFVLDAVAQLGSGAWSFTYTFHGSSGPIGSMQFFAQSSSGGGAVEEPVRSSPWNVNFVVGPLTPGTLVTAWIRAIWSVDHTVAVDSNHVTFVSS